MKKKRNPMAALLKLFKPKKVKSKKKYSRKDKHKSLGLVLLCLLILGGCSSTPTIQTVTEYRMPNVVHPNDPEQPLLLDFNVLVVNKELLEELAKSVDNNSSFIMVAPEDYESIVKNFNALKSYILNQKGIILYYRKILTPEDKK